MNTGIIRKMHFDIIFYLFELYLHYFLFIVLPYGLANDLCIAGIRYK